MKKLYSLLLTALFALPAAHVHATDYTQGLSIWFDTPNTLQGRAIWYGSRPDLWKGESKTGERRRHCPEPRCQLGVAIIAHWKRKHRSQHHGLDRSGTHHLQRENSLEREDLILREEPMPTGM